MEREEDANLLGHLRGLRYDWSDEIPEEIIHSDAPPDKRYSKARTSWFTSVTADVYYALEEGEIKTPQGKAVAEQLITRFTSEEWANQDLTTAEDIQEANRLIDIILTEEGKLSP